MSFTKNMYSMFDAIKNTMHKIDLKKWAQSIGGSSADAVYAALCFVLAFGAGFLLKKYFKYLFVGALIALVTIKFLEYNKVLSINWGVIQAATGIRTAADLNTWANVFIAWIKNNVFLFVSVSIGFLLGYRLG